MTTDLNDAYKYVYRELCKRRNNFTFHGLNSDSKTIGIIPYLADVSSEYTMETLLTRHLSGWLLLLLPLFWAL